MDALETALRALLSEVDTSEVLRFVETRKSKRPIDRITTCYPYDALRERGVVSTCDELPLTRYVFSTRAHMGVVGCLHVTAYDEAENVILDESLAQSQELRAFSGTTQDEVAAAIKEYVQNAQDAVLKEEEMQLTGQLGDGVGASLAVLMRHGVKVSIEVRRHVQRSTHLRVSASSDNVLVITNVSSTCFGISSLVNGMSDKRARRTSDASSIYDCLVGHTNERAFDGVERCETRVVLAFPLFMPLNVPDVWFLADVADRATVFDVCRSHSIHVQAKIVEEPGPFRLFETGLYLEHETLPSVASIHINVTRSGARASHTRDRTFVGFDALEFEASTEAAERLANVIMPHIEAVGPHAAALLVRLSKAVKLPWPKRVVPVASASDVMRVLPPQFRSVVVEHSQLRETFDNRFVYDEIFASATTSDVLTRKAKSCVLRVGGTAPRIFIHSLCEGDFRLLMRELPCPNMNVDSATASVRVDDVVYVPRDFFPDLVSGMLLCFRFIRLFDILRKTFDMSDTDEGHTFCQETRLGVRSDTSMSASAYFTPLVPQGCGSSIILQPCGDLVYVRSDVKVSPRAAFASIGIVGRIDASELDMTPVTLAAQRCSDPAVLVSELEDRPYGSCVLRDINDPSKPIQCIARSLMYVMLMRKFGYDAVYLRSDSHAIAMLRTSDGYPAYFVECCTHGFTTRAMPVPADSTAFIDPDFLRFYQMFLKMQRRIGAGKSEALFCELVEKAA